MILNAPWLAVVCSYLENQEEWLESDLWIQRLVLRLLIDISDFIELWIYIRIQKPQMWIIHLKYDTNIHSQSIFKFICIINSYGHLIQESTCTWISVYKWVYRNTYSYELIYMISWFCNLIRRFLETGLEPVIASITGICGFF